MKTLVVLVGPQGSGKSTYCQKYLSDHTRISQDDQGKEGHRHAFADAIRRGDTLIVVDRINHLQAQRTRYIFAAKAAGYKTKIIWLDVGREVCKSRIELRTDHPTLQPKSADVALDHYFNNFQPPAEHEADELLVVKERIGQNG